MSGDRLEIEGVWYVCAFVCVGIGGKMTRNGDDGDRSVEGVRSGLKTVVKAAG